MPAGDRTGPMGAGPMTGWGMGYCVGYPAAGFDAPGWANWGPGRRFAGRGGRGMRTGRGGGYRWRHWYYATGLPRWARWGPPPAQAHAAPSREDEIGMLREEAEWLKSQLDAINQRMDELSQE
jgi:hypothetical protein